MNVQAMIMAGGEGVRLRPLTVYLPKPLVPLAGEPVMGYSLRLLRQHGITDVGATLWYRPREIRNCFGRGEKYGVKLQYYEENRPMGTAGSMKMAQDHLKGTFIVLSGDGLTDCDLTAALAFHREKKALATLVLRRVHVPLPYGVVLCGEDGRITRFIEKPAWKNVFSNLVNTGIYILEKEIFDAIPDQGAPDFGRDIFPALVEKKLPVYGFETAAYWCDVGDLNAYLKAQQALLKGETAFSVPTGVDAGARVDPTARIEGDCLVAGGAVIGPGAVIRNAVIGEDCTVAGGAVIENACLWRRAAVGGHARVMSSVLCTGAALRQGAEMNGGNALGEGALVGANAQLLPGVRIWPHLKVLPDMEVRRSLVSGDSTLPQWTKQGVLCETAEEACAVIGAYAGEMKPRQVLVGRGEGGTDAMAELACGALAARGVRVLRAGEMTASMLRSLVRLLRLDGGVFAGRERLMLADGRGAPLSSRQASALDGRVLRGEKTPEFARPGQVIRLKGAEEIYLARTLPLRDKPLFSPVMVCSASPLLLHLAERGLWQMNARDARFCRTIEPGLRMGEIAVLLSEDGESLALTTEGGPVEKVKSALLLLRILLQKQGTLFDLPGVPRAAGLLSPLQKPDDSEACLLQRSVMEDGLMQLFLLCDALKDEPADGLMQSLPETHIRTLEAPCLPRDKGRILHALCGSVPYPHTLGDGVRFRHERGYATVAPDSYRSAVTITSESADSEFAKELCDFYLEKIRRITNMP